MPATLAALPKGHEFSLSAFDLSQAWVADYVAAVEDEAISALGDFVPPMATAALSIRALLKSAALPAGTIHLGQDLNFVNAASAGERLTVAARVASRGERRDWVLMAVELDVRGQTDASITTGRATVTFPNDAAAALPAVESDGSRDELPGRDLPSVVKEITQEKINRYAAASGDYNPLHVDPAFGTRTRFGGTIAHGMLVLAYVSEMMTEAFGESWLAGGRLKARFRAPARPGDTVTTSGQLVRHESTLRTYAIACINGNGDVLISGEAEVRE
ncbi:MAG: MaoC/PaaZ C-terminal domain-containing protein [Vicinamibacterales bacterium]